MTRSTGLDSFPDRSRTNLGRRASAADSTSMRTCMTLMQDISAASEKIADINGTGLVLASGNALRDISTSVSR